MGKGKKNRNYKTSPITCLEDGLAILGNLIISSMLHLEKYVAYANEVDNVIRQYTTVDANEKAIRISEPIPEVIFHNLNDKLMFRQMMLLKLLADEQNASFSYKSLRKILKKQGYLQKELSQENSQILNELLDIRNWSFHNPQSFHTAQKEVMMRSIPDQLKSLVRITPQLNPVYAKVHNFYDVTYLCSLSLHTEKRAKQFQTVIDSMKQDYEEMYQRTNPHGMSLFGGELFDMTKVQFKIYRIDQPKQLLDSDDLTAQVSMAIQKGKYDGSDEAFHKWTLNRLQSDGEVESK